MLIKKCKTCCQELSQTEFYSASSARDKLTTKCKQCYKTEYKNKSIDRYHTKYKHDLTHLISCAKSRAKKQGVPFCLSKTDIDIPDVCPILHIPLVRTFPHSTGTSPSLDRIVPEKGYVPGNIRVISSRANSMKSNVTKQQLEEQIQLHLKTAEDLSKILKYISERQ